jgi:hypothetical protein
VVVVAAAAVYIAFVAEDKEEITVAPGTMMKYELYADDEKYAVAEEYFIGQNADEYFVKIDVVTDTSTTTAYQLSPKKVGGMKKTGTAEIETFEGTKKLDIIEYSTDTSGVRTQVKAYADPSNGLSYVNELTVQGYTERQVLIDYNIELQTTPYKESDSIGMEYEYDCFYDGRKLLRAYVTCIADCIDGQFGVKYDIGGGPAYFVSNDPQGLPVNAVYKGTNVLTNTIEDRDVPTELFELNMYNIAWKFYCEPDSKIVYEVNITQSGVTFTLNLTKKPVESI